MGVGSLFGDNEAGNNVSDPNENMNSGDNEAGNNVNDPNENMNSGDSVATPRHAMHPPHRLDGQSHKRAVCVPPQVAIKKAMHILHNADSCTKAPVSSTDEKSDLQAPTLNAEGIPDALPTPPVGRHQVRKGPLSNITPDALKAGRKGLRPVGERQRPSHDVNNNAMTKQLEAGKTGLRPVGQRQRPSHEVNNNAMTKQLEAGKTGLRPVGQRQRPSHEVNNDEMTKQLEAGKTGLRPVGQRQRPSHEVNNDEMTTQLKAGRIALRPIGERQAARRGPARDAAPAENAEQSTFHNSEGGNSFLDKLGQKVAGKVLQGANVG